MSQPPVAIAARATRTRYIVILLLCILSFLTYYDRNCITRVQGLIQKDLGLSDAQMGLVFTAFWLAYALFEIPGGWLCDRFGGRGTLTRIVIAWSLFTALTGSATGLWSLLAFRFLFGAGEAGAYPSMARIQGTWLPPRTRARAGGLLWLTARWGAAFAPLIFGAIMRFFDAPSVRDALAGTPLEHTASWRLGFWVSGLLGVVWVAFFWWWFRDHPADKPSVNPAELELIRDGRTDHAPASHAPVPGLFKSLFTSRSLWAIALLYIFVSFAWSFFVSWMPRFFKSVHGVAFEKSELISGMPLFFGGIACLAGGLFSDWLVKSTGRKRFGRAIFPVCGYLAASGAMVGVRFAQTPAQATMLFCVAAFALDFGQGANWASIVDIGGRYAGTATGFINMVGNLGGNALQPIVGAWIFNNLGWNFLFATYAATCLAAAAMWFLINPHHRFYQEPPPARGFEVLPAR